MNGIQEVARSIRVSSTSKISHYLVLGQHRTEVLSENCPNLSRFRILEIQKRVLKYFRRNSSTPQSRSIKLSDR